MKKKSTIFALIAVICIAVAMYFMYKETRDNYDYSDDQEPEEDPEEMIEEEPEEKPAGKETKLQDTVNEANNERETIKSE